MTARVPRPSVHFTPRQGWINDPLGLTFHDGEYHMFFQYVPEQTDWGPNCHWGHATTRDLLRWTEHAPALVSGDGDDGCWSGSVVGPTDGGPVLFYTSVTVPDIRIGVVRRAHPADDAWQRWVKDPDVAVRLPPDVAATDFRDPYVFRDGHRWRMLVGAGLNDGTATALHYSSTDLRDWTYDGRLAERSTDDAEPVWTGALWECPQLFRLGDRHVLVVSVWHADRLHHVAYAVGDYGGGRFVAHTWDQLSYGTSYYAASTFLDEDGRRGLIYWLRDVGDRAGGWVGALSVPHVLHVVDGRLRAAPHPRLETLRGEAGVEPAPAVDVEWSPEAGAVLHLQDAEGSAVAEIRRKGGQLTVTGLPSVGAGSRSVPYGSGPVRAIADGPVLEVFTDRGVLAAAIGAGPDGVRPVDVGGGKALRWWRLDAPLWQSP